MGGRSRAGCRVTPDGLVLEGELVETGGGFVSCRSPRLQPPLDLSPYSALQLDVEGEGRTLKIALGCRDGAMGLTELIPGGLRWVVDVPDPTVRFDHCCLCHSPTSGPRCVPSPLACRCASIPVASPAFRCCTRNSVMLARSQSGVSRWLHPGADPFNPRLALSPWTFWC